MLKALYSRSGIEKDFLGSNPTLALNFGFIGNLKKRNAIVDNIYLNYIF